MPSCYIQNESYFLRTVRVLTCEFYTRFRHCRSFIQTKVVIPYWYMAGWLVLSSVVVQGGSITKVMCAHNNLKQNKYNNLQLYLALVDNIINHYYNKFYFEKSHGLSGVTGMV